MSSGSLFSLSLSLSLSLGPREAVFFVACCPLSSFDRGPDRPLIANRIVKSISTTAACNSAGGHCQRGLLLSVVCVYCQLGDLNRFPITVAKLLRCDSIGVAWLFREKFEIELHSLGSHNQLTGGGYRLTRTESRRNSPNWKERISKGIYLKLAAGGSRFLLNKSTW